MVKKSNISSVNEDELLELAKQSLEIESIVLRGSAFNLHESIEPGVNAEGKHYQVQQATESQGYSVVDVDDKKLVLVRHAFGLRFTNPDEEAEDDDKTNLIHLEALYAVSYGLKEGKELPSDEAIKLFAEVNTPYSLWPFWREHAHSITQKAGMSAFTLPFYYCDTKENASEK